MLVTEEFDAMYGELFGNLGASRRSYPTYESVI